MSLFVRNIFLSDLLNQLIKKSEKLVDKCFSVFDSLIEKINQKDISNKKTHFKKISLELTKKAEELVKNFNDL